MSKVWFVTGAGRGFGREFILAALERGDRVAATARKTEDLADLKDRYGDLLLPLQLDVTDREACRGRFTDAVDHFGRIDVLVNNAGFGVFGTAEELPEDLLRKQMEVNFFGLVWVTQAAIPVMRAQGGGHIIQISSVAGLTTIPGMPAYHASKWAVEGFTESMSKEIRQFGIRVTLVEPGGYATDWKYSSAARSPQLPEYAELHAAFNPGSSGYDPSGVGPALLKVVDAPEPPLRVFFGTRPHEQVNAAYPERLATWAAWYELSEEAEGR